MRHIIDRHRNEAKGLRRFLSIARSRTTGQRTEALRRARKTITGGARLPRFVRIDRRGPEAP